MGQGLDIKFYKTEYVNILHLYTFYFLVLHISKGAGLEMTITQLNWEIYEWLQNNPRNSLNIRVDPESWLVIVKFQLMHSWKLDLNTDFFLFTINH